MSGSRAPMVALQAPLSLVKAVGPPGHSPDTLTSFAFGARKRNVTVRSEWTSGDTSGAASRRGRALVRAGSAFGGAASWARREMSERTDRSKVTVFIVGNRMIKRGGPGDVQLAPAALFSIPIFFRNGSSDHRRWRNFSIETFTSRESP